MTRIYLRDDWATKIGDLPSKTTITQEVKVVFTIGGTGITGTVTEDTGTTTAESTTTTSESTTVTTETTTTTTTATTTTRKPIEDIDPNAFYGDVNLDAKIDLTDAIILNKFCADTVQLNDQQLANANCDAMGGVDLNDTIVLLQFLVHLVNELPYQG